MFSLLMFLFYGNIFIFFLFLLRLSNFTLFFIHNQGFCCQSKGKGSDCLACNSAGECKTCAANYWSTNSECAVCESGKTSPSGSVSRSDCVDSSSSSCSDNSPIAGSDDWWTCNDADYTCNGYCCCNSGRQYSGGGCSSCRRRLDALITNTTTPTPIANQNITLKKAKKHKNKKLSWKSNPQRKEQQPQQQQQIQQLDLTNVPALLSDLLQVKLTVQYQQQHRDLNSRRLNNNNCEYSNDGTCDVPDYCEAGTDCTDCTDCDSTSSSSSTSSGSSTSSDSSTSSGSSTSSTSSSSSTSSTSSGSSSSSSDTCKDNVKILTSKNKQCSSYEASSGSTTASDSVKESYCKDGSSGYCCCPTGYERGVATNNYEFCFKCPEPTAETAKKVYSDKCQSANDGICDDATKYGTTCSALVSKNSQFKKCCNEGTDFTDCNKEVPCKIHIIYFTCA